MVCHLNTKPWTPSALLRVNGMTCIEEQMLGMTVGSSKAGSRWITAVDGLRAAALKGLLIHLETTSMSDFVTGLFSLTACQT